MSLSLYSLPCSIVDAQCTPLSFFGPTDRGYQPLNFLLSGLTPCPTASSGASPTQKAAWETRDRGPGSSLGSSSDSDHSSEPVGYSSGNISSQVSKCKYREAMHATKVSDVEPIQYKAK